MNAKRQVSVFRNGRNQAVRIPREFALPGPTVMMWQEGTRLIIETKPKRNLLDLLDELEPLGPEDRMGPIEELPWRDVDL